jgi:Leucine-rich repeat (LRR) protein
MLSGTRVTDISVLQELKNLTQFSLPHANVTDISALRELKNLTDYQGAQRA